MAPKFENDWQIILQEEFEKDYYQKLRRQLKNEYRSHPVYPAMDQIFNALHYTSYQDTKVLLLGQDPYHGENQAHGLCFSVSGDQPVPPSLKNIYKELRDDLGCSIPNHGYLKKWADQGVLMLNAVLTVRAGQAASHKKIGWELFTDRIIDLLNQKEEPVVFLLWGNFAQSKASLIDNPRHLILRSPHPSPLSANRGFFGSRPFSKVNHFLQQHHIEPIDWCIDYR
jgi:uracil-DNA glycosylase